MFLTSCYFASSVLRTKPKVHCFSLVLQTRLRQITL